MRVVHNPVFPVLNNQTTSRFWLILLKRCSGFVKKKKKKTIISIKWFIYGKLLVFRLHYGVKLIGCNQRPALMCFCNVDNQTLADAAPAPTLMGSNAGSHADWISNLFIWKWDESFRIKEEEEVGWKCRLTGARTTLFPLPFFPERHAWTRAQWRAAAAALSHISSKMNSYQGGYAKIMKLPFQNAVPCLWRIHFSCGGWVIAEKQGL